MIKLCAAELTVPITVKIRIFEDVKKTIEYAKMIQSSGASILTVHGRTREMKGHKTGLADWSQIRAVKKALDIPVFANGNILYESDAIECLKQTGCDGVMSAEGNLYNPCIFSNIHPPSYQIALEVSALNNKVSRYLPRR